MHNTLHVADDIVVHENPNAISFLETGSETRLD